ncbi:DNA primase [Flavobacteriaceae bacterium UJ101]|nr:DNA primase [Flavobacteriaceae bacterium UJ101]
MIKQETIDEIFATVRVEEIIGDYVNLKRAGSNMKGLSPFSEERTPSFVVSPAKQIWKDFSSGKGGNAVTFLMEVEQYTYPEALRYIAKKYNIEIKEDRVQNEEQKEKIAERESLFLVNEYANKYFQEQLWQSKEGKAIGLSYFKERDFTEETIKKFDLGFSPDQWEAFTNEALKNGYKIDYLSKVGLTIVKENKKFDRFKGRVLFPIHSFSGRVLGFGGRILKSNDKAAKYLNSPESPIYHKSHILYGIYHSKQAIIREDNCFLVEGYTDVISFHQNGIENVVASSGTALTKEQIRLVKRLTNNITILYDGDAAGIKASFRGIDLILEQDMNVKVLLFPDGEDPDSFARKSTQSELKEYLAQNTKDFIQFKTQILLEDTQGDPIKKAALIRDIVSSIGKIDNLIKRELYVRETATLLDVREETLFKELSQLDQAKDREDKKQNTRTPNQPPPLEALQPKSLDVNSANELEQRIVELLMTYGSRKIIVKDFDEEGKEAEFEVTVAEEIIERLREDDLHLKIAQHKKIYDLFSEGINHGEIRDSQFFMKLVDEDIQTQVSHILAEKYTLHDWKRNEVMVTPIEKIIPKAVTEAIYRYKFLRVLESEKQFLENIKQGGDHTENMTKLMKMQKIRQKIALKLNRPI